MATLMAVDDRFWSKVAGDDVETCWLWTAGTDGKGYGWFYVGLRDGKRVSAPAHRWIYQHLVCELPSSLVIDHLCRVRHCVNPWHMEPVSSHENTLRGHLPKRRTDADTCVNGHPWVPQNVYTNPTNGYEKCRPCARASALRSPRASRASK